MAMQSLYTFGCLLVGLLLSGCAEETFHSTPIRIGKEEALSAVTLNRSSERHILLSGGNGKYRAFIEDGRIAEVKVHHDTLKIRALFEGETYASVHSHDQSQRLDIRIIPPTLTFSTDSILLFPKEETKFVALFGGGDKVRLTKDDPDDIFSYKWDGNNHLLEINAHYEGDARLIAETESGEKQQLHIRVRPQDQPTQMGIYGTGGKFYANNLSMRCALVVYRPGKETIFSNVANPHGGRAYTYIGSVIAISPIVNPKVNQRIPITVTQKDGPETAVPPGVYDALVERIDSDKIILRSKRHKFVLPYRP